MGIPSTPRFGNFSNWQVDAVSRLIRQPNADQWPLVIVDIRVILR